MNTPKPAHSLVLDSLKPLGLFTDDDAINDRSCIVVCFLEEVIEERIDQIKKWGDGDDRGELLYLDVVKNEEAGEVSRAILELREASLAGFPKNNAEHLEANVRREAIQLAAVCANIVERIDSGSAWIALPPEQTPDIQPADLVFQNLAMAAPQAGHELQPIQAS
jgi:hypothetical protein